MTDKASEVLKELKNEIQETLYFFIDCDLQIEGYIKESTKELFKIQKVKFPAELEEFVKYKIS